jgi:hypothetical protein
MNKYYCLIPENLSIEKMIKNSKPNFIYNTDYFYWIVSQIITRSTYRLDSEEKNEWISMCAEIMKKQPYSYRNHLRYLCSNFKKMDKVLLRKDFTTGRCYSYKLTAKYFNSKVKIYEIKDKNIIKHKRKISKGKMVTYNNKFKKRYEFLAKYFSSGELKIDFKGAMKENNELYKSSYNDPNEALKKQRLNAIQITAILNEEYNLAYNDKTDGRIHTVVTRLSKPLRKFMTYKGQKFGEIDISSSVPTFLYFILKEINKPNPGKIFSKVIINNKSIKSNHYIFQKSFESPNTIEVSSFGKEILEGTFYECFKKDVGEMHRYEKSLKKDQYISENVRRIFGREFDGDLKDLKKVLKKQLLSMMNAKPKNYRVEQRMFHKHFPEILKWINEFKKENHKLFSYMMLQTESYFMLDLVARKINKKYSGKKTLFTLHDCILTTEDNLDLVYNLMQEILETELSFTPKMTKELWS